LLEVAGITAYSVMRGHPQPTQAADALVLEPDGSRAYAR